ncbi:hypothetical protein D3C83_255460 [compost metagenome]
MPVAEAMVLAVAHKEYLAMETSQLARKMNAPLCLVDVKSRLDMKALKAAGIAVWRL